MRILTARQLKDYDLAKALKEARLGGLSGLESEVNEAAKEDLQIRGVRYSAGIILPPDLMQAIAGGGVVTPEGELTNEGILAQLGVTVLSDLNNATIELLHGAEFKSQFLNEGDPGIEADGNNTTGKIDSRRVIGSRVYKNSYLAQTSNMSNVMQDMIDSIETSIAKELFLQILALPALNGFDSAAAATALSWQNITALNAAVTVPRLREPKYVLGGSLYASLEATPKASGSARMILEEEEISCYKTLNVRDLLQPSGGKHQAIFGDFARAFVGMYSGVEIIVDPYKRMDNGETILTWYRRVDVDVNPYAFKTIQNASA